MRVLVFFCPAVFGNVLEDIVALCSERVDAAINVNKKLTHGGTVEEHAEIPFLVSKIHSETVLDAGIFT